MKRLAYVLAFTTLGVLFTINYLIFMDAISR